MKKLCTIAALVGVLTALSASAMTVNQSRVPGYFTLPGGEFTITSVTPDPAFDNLYKNYASAATLNGGFQTFCINTSINVKNSPLDAMVGSGAVSLGAGFLYSQFAHGTLAGYDYTPGSGRAASAWALQNAIWALQKQNVFDQTAANTFLSSVQFSSVFANLAAAQLGGGEVYGVRQLLMDKVTVGTAGANGTVITPSQPMLVLVPDGGMTLMLLGFALSGLGLISRKIGI